MNDPMDSINQLGKIVTLFLVLGIAIIIIAAISISALLEPDTGKSLILALFAGLLITMVWIFRPRGMQW